jgi:two-component system sensor histidine kinase KdpD
VILDVPVDLPPVELDYVEIDQVLTNLLENAVKYSPPGSAIEVGARVSDDMLVVEVRDRGLGVPKADAGRIFEPFVRGRQAGEQSRGSGLGLSVARGLVAAHGGSIGVEPRPGGGSTFRFTLPALDAEPFGARTGMEA